MLYLSAYLDHLADDRALLPTAHGSSETLTAGWLQFSYHD